MSDQRFRLVSFVFLTAVLVHGADHLRRGPDVVTAVVRTAGALQLALAVAAVVLVVRRHPAAPLAAIAVGLPSAVLFAASHLLPHWSSFSDSFTGSETGPGVNAFSWFSAVFEIAADLAFAFAGLLVLRGQEVRTRAA